MKAKYSKNLYVIYTNDHQHIIVKSNPDLLEYMVQNDMIIAWTGLKYYELKEAKQWTI